MLQVYHTSLVLVLRLYVNTPSKVHKHSVGAMPPLHTIHNLSTSRDLAFRLLLAGLGHAFQKEQCFGAFASAICRRRAENPGLQARAGNATFNFVLQAKQQASRHRVL
jgi:hypothetical protein